MLFNFYLLYLFGAFILSSTPATASQSDLTKEALEFLESANEVLRQRYREEVLAIFKYNTNVTEENRQAMVAVGTENAKINKALALELERRHYDEIETEFIQRQVEQMSNIGLNILPDRDYEKVSNAISSMQSNYATATVCDYRNSSNCDLPLKPFLGNLWHKNRNLDELIHYWKEWYEVTGKPVRHHFKTYVDLLDKAAKAYNVSSYADVWISYYGDEKFEENLDACYKAILPLYKEIHAYVRYNLNRHYGDDIVPADGNIPIHVIGNMWGEMWDQAIELYMPFPDKPLMNVDDELKRQGYTVHKMFELGDDFFKSLKMRALPASFWNLSVFERPADREIICHPFAWDFYENSDVRVKMCAQVNTMDLYMIHHELGHMQHYLQYEKQPTIFRAGPNPGFNEAIGDVIALSVTTAKHLHRIGLASKGQLDNESRINELFKMALQKVIFLPFAYTLDKFRYSVFRGEIPEPIWNCVFWQMRSQFAGVEPPVPRSDENFDPPAKYHIDANIEFNRYFAALIFQFQFFKALCIKADQYDPLDADKTFDNCDIYGSVKAGKAFSEFLSHGSSIHWKKALFSLSGELTMNPDALLEYFEPLHKWLRAENRRLGIKVGWTNTKKVSPECWPPFKV